jgi:hypothetical protein
LPVSIYDRLRVLGISLLIALLSAFGGFLSGAYHMKKWQDAWYHRPLPKDVMFEVDSAPPGCGPRELTFKELRIYTPGGRP